MARLNQSKAVFTWKRRAHLPALNYSFEPGRSSIHQLHDSVQYFSEKVKRLLPMSDKPPPYPGIQPQQPGYPTAGPGYTALPQKPAYPPSGTTTTVIQQPAAVVLAAPFFGDTPVQTVCTNCGANIITSTMYENGQLTWLACVALCLIGCDGGCCLIPFCLDSVKDVTHFCPNCDVQLGVFHRM